MRVSPDRLGRPAELPGDPPGDLREPTLAADRRHPTGPADDLVALLVGQLAEPGPPVDLVLVVGDEPPDARLQEPDLGPAVDQEPPGDQALATPAGDRPGRDVEPPADGLDRQDLLGRLLHLLLDGRREVLDEQPEVVADVVAVQHQGRRPLGAEVR